VKLLKEIDEAILKYITAIVWWVDVRFSKDNVWCAHTSFVYLPTLVFFASSPWAEAVKKGVLFEQIVWSALLSSIIYWAHVFFWWFIFEFSETPTSMLLGQAKKTPNPNKYYLTTKLMKVCFITFIIGTYIKYKEWCEWLTFFGHTLSIYLLCVDNIPPAEKRKQQEARETKNMVPASTM
jgi:hypothetical protein